MRYNNISIDVISNFIWKDNEDCQEILNHIKKTFNRENIKRISIGNFFAPDLIYKYVDGELILEITNHYNGISTFFSKSIFINGDKVDCSPLMKRKVWRFFDKMNILDLGPTKSGIKKAVSDIRR